MKYITYEEPLKGKTFTEKQMHEVYRDLADKTEYPDFECWKTDMLKSGVFKEVQQLNGKRKQAVIFMQKKLKQGKEIRRITDKGRRITEGTCKRIGNVCEYCSELRVWKKRTVNRYSKQNLHVS